MSAQFTDYKTSYARTNAHDLDPARDARLFVEPEPFEESPERLRKQRRMVADVHNATCNAFTSIGLPLKLRAFVPVILAAYAHDKEACERGSTTFKASYSTLANLLNRQGDGRTDVAKKSEVRRLIGALEKWQLDNKRTLCTIRRGGKSVDEAGKDVFHDTEFDLVILDCLGKALVRNPEPDRMRAAVRVEVAAMMKLPPFDSRWQVKPPTPDQMRERDRKAALTNAAKAVDATFVAGGDPVEFAKALAAEIIRQAEEKYVATPCEDTVENPASVESVELEGEGGVSVPTHPPTPPTVRKIAPYIRKNRVLKTEELIALAGSPELTPEEQAEAERTFDRLCVRLRETQPFSVAKVELRQGAGGISPTGE